ncbi:PBECR4 domain-containing protein [Veillonella sp.]|uniref:PBECR4 domain-containing protein n=1 Tax=Veillonella sp. TaxID=1926307 RepID=UPI0025EB6793|nr:PBECR4 domain-containing protein [Veillonella sp.]
MNSFKENIRGKLVAAAKAYLECFINVEYLIYSRFFVCKRYYILTAKEDNFLHLTGVTSSLSPKEFFSKCISDELTENDFDIFSKQQKGSVRRKVGVLSTACHMFMQEKLVAEEQFIKNRIRCAIASSDGSCTLGFTDTQLHVPQTLLKGNELTHPVQIEAILSRQAGEVKFNNIIFIKSDIAINQIFDN